MSTELLEEVQKRTKRTNRTLRLQRCELNLQAYSHTGLLLKHVAPIHLTVGLMDLVHPVYVSPLKTYPLLIGKDLLNRFEPLIDFKHLKMWTQSSNHDRNRCPRHISVRHGTSPVGRELSHQPEAIQNIEAKTSVSTTCR